MNYITIEAKTYEEAVKKARRQYGDRLRIHSRRDKEARGFLGLGVSRSCEITCFLADDGSEKQTPAGNDEEAVMLRRFEQEAITPDPRKGQVNREPEQPENNGQETQALMHHARRILELNDFSPSYTSWIMGEMEKQLHKAYPAIPTEKELEMSLADRIIGSVDIDYRDQGALAGIVVLLGPEGSGKTTAMAKIAALYRQGGVALASVSSNAGTEEQLKKLGTALDMPVKVYRTAQEFRNLSDDFSGTGLVLVDTNGKPAADMEPDQRLYEIFNTVGRGRFTFLLTLPATMKYSDISQVVSQASPYQVKAVVVTMADCTGTIGNIISACRENVLPLLFVTDGKRIPKDMGMASASFIAGRLRGFSTDLTRLLDQQGSGQEN